MKKIVCLLLVLMFVFAATGCGPEIADTNGPDDYTLATITDENIINRDLGASGYSMSPGSDSDDYMVDITTIKGKEFSGVAELYGTNLLGKSDMDIELWTVNVKEGNFKVAVVLDDKIVHEFNNEDIAQTCELRDVNGYVAIMIAGETSKFKIEMSIR